MDWHKISLFIDRHNHRVWMGAHFISLHLAAFSFVLFALISICQLFITLEGSWLAVRALPDGVAKTSRRNYLVAFLITSAALFLATICIGVLSAKNQSDTDAKAERDHIEMIETLNLLEPIRDEVAASDSHLRSFIASLPPNRLSPSELGELKAALGANQKAGTYLKAVPLSPPVPVSIAPIVSVQPQPPDQSVDSKMIARTVTLAKNLLVSLHEQDKEISTGLLGPEGIITKYKVSAARNGLDKADSPIPAGLATTVANSCQISPKLDAPDAHIDWDRFDRITHTSDIILQNKFETHAWLQMQQCTPPHNYSELVAFKPPTFAIFEQMVEYILLRISSSTNPGSTPN